MATLKYLEVEFGDNDFGWPVRDAMKRLWGYMHTNNAHHRIFIQPPRPAATYLAKLFKTLNDKDLLLPMLARLVDCEYNAGGVEYATRGVHDMDKWPGVDGHKVPIATKSITERYLTLTLRFHSNRKFTKTCQNGEHAWLNLETGEADCF